MQGSTHKASEKEGSLGDKSILLRQKTQGNGNSSYENFCRR